MGLEKGADAVVAGLPLPIAFWMGMAGNPISAVGLALLSTVAILRLTSTSVRRWTDDHRWAFLGVLLPIGALATLGAMP